MSSKNRNYGTNQDYQAPQKAKPQAYTSPWYDALFHDWIFYKDSVKGGDSYLGRNIFMHGKENLRFFKKRLDRAVFPNHARLIINTYAGLVYKAKINRKGDDDVLPGFWKDIDGAGTTADSFFERVYKKALIFGHCFVNVSRIDPARDEDAASLADQIDAGMKPFAKIISPLDLVDWALDSKSRFEWAMVQEPKSIERKFDQAYDKEIAYCYRLWTKKTWTLYDVEPGGRDGLIYTEIESGTHEVGEVPIYAVYIGDRDESNQPVSESLLKDIVPQVRRIANLISLIDEQIYQHVFNLLVVPEDVWDSLAEQDFSVAGSLPLPNDAQPYSYLAPDVSQIDIIQKQVEATEISIRFLSGLGRSNESSKSGVSAKSLAFQNTDKKALVIASASRMADLEVMCSKAAAKWMGKEVEDIEVLYNIQIDPGEVEQVLKDCLSFASLDISGLAATQNNIHATRAHLGQWISQEDLEGVVTDIEERSERGDDSSLDIYPITNAQRARLLAVTPEVIKAAHIATKRAE